MLEWIGWLFLVFTAIYSMIRCFQADREDLEDIGWAFVCAACGLAAIGLAPFKVVLS